LRAGSPYAQLPTTVSHKEKPRYGVYVISRCFDFGNDRFRRVNCACELFLQASIPNASMMLATMAAAFARIRGKPTLSIYCRAAKVNNNTSAFLWTYETL